MIKILLEVLGSVIVLFGIFFVFFLLILLVKAIIKELSKGV